MNKRMFTNIQTGEVTDCLPPLDCVCYTPLKKYNKQDYRKRKFRELRSRILLEYRFNKSQAYFITLTYDDRCYPENEQKLYKDLDLFLKRLRRFQEYHFPDYNEKIKYFAVVEKSKECTKRFHHHMVMFGLHPTVARYMCRSDSFMENIWNCGFVTARPLLSNKIYYLTKYLFKDQEGVVYKYHCSKGFGFNRKLIKYNIVQFQKFIFRFGKHWYKMPRSYCLKALGIKGSLKELKKKCFEKFKYYAACRTRTSIFFDKPQVVDFSPAILFYPDKLEYEIIPRFMHEQYLKQIEYNRYGSCS